MNSTELLDSINNQTRTTIACNYSRLWFEQRANYGGAGRTLATLKWELLKSRLPKELHEICEKDGIHVGEWICPNSFSAKVIKSSDGWLVAIPSGLFQAVYQVTRSIASWIPLGGEHLPACDEHVARNELQVALRWIADTGLVFTHGKKLSSERLIVAESLATYAEWFVICHELVHALFAHKPLTQLEMDSGMWLPHHLLGSMRFHKSGPNVDEVSSSSHAIEHGADLRGMEFLLASICNLTLDSAKAPEITRQHVELGWAGAKVYLMAAQALWHLNDADRCESHPEPWVRYQSLRSDWIADRKNVESEAVALVDNRLSEAVGYCLGPVISWAESLQGTASIDSGVAEFVVMFESAARCDTPNYLTVLMETNRLLESEGGPVIANAIKSEWNKVYRLFWGNPEYNELIGYDTNGVLMGECLHDLEPSHWRIQLRRYKLLLSLARRLPPMLTVYLGMPDPW